ncbi:MAG TPA: penicillin-binding protein 2 [Cellvibrio sp.]|nr:penicillin-binding protein 2 [Cellvibrio sp.]
MFENEHFKDHQKEALLFKTRLGVMIAVMSLLFAVLIYRYYDLQVINTLDYVTQSEHNRVHVEPIPPTRGLIYDANGMVVADNRPSYTLAIIINKNYDLDATLALLKTLVEITPADLDKFYKLKKQQIHPLEPIPLRYRLTEDEIARLAVNEYRLEGVQVDAELVRDYPHGDLFAHTVGYVSRISESDVAQFDEEKLRRYNGTHAIGKIGIESSYEDYLLGEVGSQNVETNARGRVQRVLERVDPQQGKNITLNIDGRLQETAAAALNGRRGAVVAIQVKTGAVLAAISNPGFDPNLFVTGIRSGDYKRLNESPDAPLLNRFLQGQYPPGSTIKPMVGLAGLHYGLNDENRGVSDPGFFMLPGNSRPYRDWKKGGHGGHVALKQAVAESCDVYFYDLGSRLGIDRLDVFGRHFGLGERTNIDVPNERKAIWPSREWKRTAKKQAWYPGDTVNMSIGQGFVLATPLQLAVMTATIANRGVRMRPQLVKAIDNVPVSPVVEETFEVTPKNWDLIFGSMAEVMRPDGRGTGKSLSRGADYSMAGKSGSAQVISYAQNIKYDDAVLNAMKERHRDHALFVAFAPLEDPEIAVMVMVENALHGASSAGPVVRYVFDAHLRGKYLKLGEPLPSYGAASAVKPAATGAPEEEEEVSAEEEEAR